MPERAPRIADGFPGQRLVVLPPAVLKRSSQLPVSRDLFVTHIGCFQSASHHFVDRPLGSDEYVLIVCLGGRGYCSLAGKRHELQVGNAIVLPPQKSHRYWADADDPWKIFWVHFKGLRAGDYNEQLGVQPGRPLFWLHDLARIVEAFEECYSHAMGGNTDADLFALSGSLARLLGLCRLAQRSTDLRKRRTEDRVLRTVRFMLENIQEPLTLTQLASVAHWTPTHYSLMFKRQLNLSPIEYFLRLKIQRACELLRVSDAKIAEVASQLGYQDPFYFSRLFRRRVGTTPRSYRQTYALRS